jgi:hypothetical protein
MTEDLRKANVVLCANGTKRQTCQSDIKTVAMAAYLADLQSTMPELTRRSRTASASQAQKYAIVA